ncbi:MAG TPA: ferredoxin [Acidimicrobiales bacterium]|nr:ferredoxin [Acidimicrobiales bacterium]
MAAFEITVDRERCMGSGNCSFWAPNTFDLDDEGLSIVTNPEGDDASKIQNAANGCPTQAISLRAVELPAP